jgi:glycosyltransferase involved in cell wall biosynthesis
MVIQEAFGFGRPIIVSDIGGMAEKVSNGINGLHVPVGSAFEWSNTIREASLMLEEWDELYKNIATPLNHSQCAQAHLCLISTLI